MDNSLVQSDRASSRDKYLKQKQTVNSRKLQGKMAEIANLSKRI